jgi:zinc protease
MSLRFALVAMFASFFASVATAAPPPTTGLPAGMQYRTSVEGIYEYDLSNGLRVLLFPDPTKETITVNVTYLVGSRFENYGETGMAHLLEHLMFKGTPNHPNVPDELTSHGCRPNGSTWTDRTNYFETFAASDDNLSWALALESDRMVNSYIAKKDLDSEMTVVRNEYESGENDPENILEERVMSTAYLWHNYGKSTIGARSDIENVPIERLQAFYHRWYQPDNAVLVVAGDFDAGKTLTKIQNTFGKIPRPTRTLPPEYTVEPVQDGERSVTLRRVGDTQAIAVAYHIPAGSDPDFPPVQVLAFILGDEPSGRLYKALVEAKKTATVNAYAYQFAQPSVLLTSARLLKDQSIDDALTTMIGINEGMAQNPPTAEEVSRAKDNMLRNWNQTMRQSEWAAIRLSEWSALGDWRLLFLERDRLKAVTPEDVARVAQAYLKRSNRTSGTFVPTKEPDRAAIPPTPDVASLVKDYKGGEGLSEGENFDASPGNIEAHLIRFTLPSGLKVVLLPKKTRGSTVNMAMSLNFGDEASLKGQAMAGRAVGEMLMSGTKHHTRQQIEDAIAQMDAHIQINGAATGTNASLETTKENLEPALRLVGEMLREPSFPADEFETRRQEALAQVERTKGEPFQVASTALDRHVEPWPPDDVRYTPTPDEMIANINKVTLDDAKNFYAKFYGASAGQMAIAGDFDPAAVRTLVTELFGDWKSPTPYTRLTYTYKDQGPLDQVLETPDKENAVFRAEMLLPLRDDDPDYPALVLGNFMTGGGFLNSRLAVRLRQKEGFSYGVRSMLHAGRWDKVAWFNAFAIHAPQNGDSLEVAFKEEIAKILDGGFTDQEVTDARSGYLQSEKVSLSSDRELVQRLVQREFQDRTLAWDAEQDKLISALTPDAIHTAMQKYISLDRMAMVRAGDYDRVKEAHSELADPKATPVR